MNEKFRQILIKQLEDELVAAKQIDPEDIAKEIHSTGFHCLMCGKCCRREYGDNRVAIVPEEIKNILYGTDLKLDDIAEPLNIQADSAEEECSFQAASGMIDEDGNIHTFGWMLHRKEEGDCLFIPDDRNENRCRIYELRPLLCSTYPFYLEELQLRTSECEGIGKNIGMQESRELSERVIKRYLCELRDTILTYKNYNAFITGKKGIYIAASNLKQGYLNYIVHSSEGSSRFTRKIEI